MSGIKFACEDCGTDYAQSWIDDTTYRFVCKCEANLETCQVPVDEMQKGHTPC